MPGTAHVLVAHKKISSPSLGICLSFLTKSQEVTPKSLLFTVFTHWAQYVLHKYVFNQRMDLWMDGWQAGRQAGKETG